jgi:MraZ protein
MFSGEYEYSLDDKGRVALPTRYREALGETIVLWRGMDGQVNGYPVAVWQRLAENMGAQNQARRAVRDISRIILSGNECPIDKQGRILIPPALREHGGLGTNLVILGMNDHLEIWSQERWQQVTQRLQTEGSDIAEQLAEIGLVL